MKKLFSSVAVAAVFLSASPASAQGTPAYNTFYYSDATHTTPVGSIRWVGCDRWDNPYYRLSGTRSAYSVEEHVGYCADGQMQPL